MKSNGFIKRLAFAALLSLGAVSGAFAQMGAKQVLVGGTDFDPSIPAVGKAYVGTNEIKMIGVFGGVLELFGTQPSKADDLDYDYSKQTTNLGERIKSHFHDGEFMAITGNPIQLDSLHYIDDKSEDWGVVWSRFKGTANKTIMSYRVSGLAPNSSVKLVIKYRSVIDPDADGYDKLKCSQSGSQQTSIKVAENPDQYNLTAGQDAAQIKHGETGVYDNSKVIGAQATAGKADADGSFFVNINMNSQYMGQNCASIQITSIEVYGTIDPQIYCEDGSSVCAGEIANVKAKGIFQGATYQWYDGGKAIAGATSPNYSFETPAGEKEYKLQLKVTYNGVEFSSNVVNVKTEKCCEIINDQGVSVPASRKVVFMDDFGEFDLSDTKGNTYKVWDYTDISNPVQKTKKTTTPFRYELDDAPLNCKFQGEGPMVDGEYAVAGVLTGYNGPYKGMDGAKLEWAGDLHGVKLATGIHYDHSGKPEGCCLLINCKDQTGGQNIYERDITHLCQNRQLFFECYITIFTSSAAGKYNPVDVTVRLTEIGNDANVIEERATQTLPSDGGTGDWVKISGQIFLEKNDAVRLEIVNNVNTDQNGNDLVLDDIIIRACAAPSLQAYFDINTFATDTITCDNSDDLIEIYAKPSEMLTNYFGGVKNTRYLYQWSLTPDDKKSWKRFGDPTEELKQKPGSNPFVGLVTDDKIYFRVIAGSDYTLSNTADEDYNADDPCASYTISEAIECVINCPACTEPADKIKIKSDKKATDKKNKKDVIELCYGESVTLSQAADITPEESEWASSDFGKVGYAIKWFESEKPGSMSDAKSIINDVIAPKIVDYNDATLGGTEMPVVLYAVDALYPDGTCKTADTIYIRFNEVPDAEFRNPEAEFCEGEGKGLVDMTLTKGTASDYTIHWWKGADTLSGTPLGDDKDEKFFEGLESTEGGMFSYQVVDNKTGCVGEVHNYEVTVNPIPDAPKDESIQYTINGNSNEILTTEKFAQTLDATLKLVWFKTEDEPNSKGSKSVEIDRSVATTSPYVFYIAYQDGDCYSKRAKVEVEVLAAPMPAVKDIDLCKDGSYDAMEGIVSTDAGYELVWFESATDTVGKALATAPANMVDVTTPGQYTLYVAQRATTAPYAQSDVAWFNVTVYDVKAPVDASRHEYCANDEAEELKADIVKDEKNYYYADEIVFVSGTSEQSTFKPDTKKSTSQTYEYKAYQKFTTPESKQECKGPSIDIKVDVVAVEKPKVNHSVSYVKSEAAATKEFVDILVKSPDAIEDEPGQTLLWSKEETGTYVKGSTSSSKPYYDELAGIGEVERQKRWVKWETTTADGLTCQSEPADIEIIISSTPAPIVKKIEICEEVFKSGSVPSDKEPEGNVKVNDNDGKLQDASSYELVWFDSKTDADAAMTDASVLSKGKRAAPSLTDVFKGVDMSDETASEWSKSLYVVQTFDDGINVTTSPASEMKIVVNATPKLQPLAHDPVCDGPVNLTDNKYWNVSNGVKVDAKYSFGGSSVTQNASSLTEAGEYTIVATSSLGCESDPLTLQLDIRKLSISMDPKSETCPGDDVEQEVAIDFSYNKNGAEAKAGDVKLTWTSEEKTSDKPTQKGNVSTPDDVKFMYTSGNFEGKAGDTHTITVKMTDGYCTATAKQTVEIGNGPAGGTFTWSETGNESTENGKNIPLTDSNKDKIEIYACGDAVTVDFSNVTMDPGSKIEWFKSQDYTSTPAKTGASPIFSKNDYGKYYVRYMNNCYAYATVSIIDASVTINTESDGSVVKCEDSEYKITIDVESKAGKATREWYKDGNLYANNSDGLSFSPLKKKDEGSYRVEYRYDGCRAELDVVDLKVKEYVKVDVEDYEMYEGKKSYIIIAGDNATAPFKFTVPSDPSDIASLTPTKTEKTSRNEGSLSAGNESFDVTAVDEDHIVNVKFESEDYCQGEVNFQVLRDAKLVLKANLDTAMCLNEEKPFTIDTIGTGAFRRPGAELKITATQEKGAETQEKGFGVVSDTLRKNVSPRETTTYKVSFTYGTQHLDTTIKVTVYNFKVEPINQVICSGEEVELKATVSPAGSKIEWFEDDKTTSLGDNPGMLSPVFDGPVSAAKSQHKYWARPYSDLVTCTSSGMTPLFVDVYRPLEGDIEDKTICEGDNVRVDAGSYGATTYIWIIDGDSIKGSRYYQDTPSETTVYKVYMTRGNVCKAEDEATVTVTTRPVIASIDSVGYRDVDIVMDPMFGTPAFRFSIDGGEWTENTHLTDLKYTTHTITVEDANGCVLKDTFVVKDPELVFPIHFSPNGDGDFEHWTVPGINETYPDAEFTIYDRWGKKLVEFKGSDEGWDGSYNGVAMPSTDYWYECIVREIDKVYTGHFTLIRR
ncbi:MAG: T9SS type B sorting domain-containing protein [Paludibacteraceae bacterium]|nr:T9SS type B sorting domain-containing protein [Paludibacteraceae bacterium]